MFEAYGRRRAITKLIVFMKTMNLNHGPATGVAFPARLTLRFRDSHGASENPSVSVRRKRCRRLRERRASAEGQDVWVALGRDHRVGAAMAEHVM
jgi:hypothetical protein